MGIPALKDFTPHAVLTPIATLARWDKKKPRRPGALSWRRRRDGWGGNRPLPKPKAGGCRPLRFTCCVSG